MSIGTNSGSSVPLERYTRLSVNFSSKISPLSSIRKEGHTVLNGNLILPDLVSSSHDTRASVSSIALNTLMSHVNADSL